MAIVLASNWKAWSNSIHKFAMAHNAEDGPIMLGSYRELAFLSNALAGEAGEAANIVKKIGRDGRSPELIAKLRGELADIRIYSHHLEKALGIDGDENCADKIMELHKRWPHVDHKPDISPRDIFTSTGTKLGKGG